MPTPSPSTYNPTGQPTSQPSSSPISRPTSTPTFIPTSLPTTSVYATATFSAYQLLGNVSSSKHTYEADAKTIRYAVAESMNDVRPGDVSIIKVRYNDFPTRQPTAQPTSSTRRLNAIELVSTGDYLCQHKDLVNITYAVTFYHSNNIDESVVNMLYENRSMELQLSVQNGDFSNSLLKFANQFGATATFQNACVDELTVNSYSEDVQVRTSLPTSLPTVTPKPTTKPSPQPSAGQPTILFQPTLQPTTDTPTIQPKASGGGSSGTSTLSDGAIAGVVFAVIFGAIIITLVVRYLISLRGDERQNLIDEGIGLNDQSSHRGYFYRD
jgi:hypothetical protein